MYCDHAEAADHLEPLQLESCVMIPTISNVPLFDVAPLKWVNTILPGGDFELEETRRVIVGGIGSIVGLGLWHD